MEKLFLIALLVTFLFCIIKVIEMKYLEKEWKPLKYVIRDSAIVFSCTVVGLIIFFGMNGTITDFFNVVTENKVLNQASTQIFTDEPGF
jgi:hypothetical protein